MLKNKKITIIGGTSGFGKWLGDYLLRKFGNKIDLTITGTNHEKAKKIAQTLKCSFNTDNIEAVKNADIVFFSVPIGITEKIIKQVCPFIKSGSIVLDVTSIKNGPSKSMMDSVNDNVLVIPTHPMFGPFISSIAGQIILLTPSDDVKSDKRYNFFKKFLENEHAKIFEVSPLEHDKMMAIIQGLTHYNMFILGETIKRLDVDIKKSFDFVSPIYKILISSIGRYANQNPKLYSDIQISNPEILKIQEIYINAAKDLNIYIKNKDEKSFIKTLKETNDFFGENADYGQKYTDKIVFMISRQVEKIENNIGKEITIINIYTHGEVKGILQKYHDETITLNDNRKYNINEWEIL